MLKHYFIHRMPTDVTEIPGLAVVAGDVLTLRGTGLAAAETWALLCQAAQALQDLFLSSKSKIMCFDMYNSPEKRNAIFTACHYCFIVTE